MLPHIRLKLTFAITLLLMTLTVLTLASATTTAAAAPIAPQLPQNLSVSTAAVTATSPLTVTSIPTAVNGVPITDIVKMPPQVITNVQAIYRKGQESGNEPTVFTAIGDSSIAGGQFMERFGKGDYNMGNFAYLQPTMSVFSDSFKRTSTAVRIGLHSWSALNPMWADKKVCNANENAVACEFRLNKPSFVFIHLGANDDAVKLFDKSMRAIVQYAIDSGVVPILITKATQPEARTNGNNDLLRKIAEEMNIPLIDYALLAETLPGRGVGADGVHMTGYQKVDYTLPSVWKSGHAMHNLAALIGLDVTYRTAISRASKAS